MTAEWIVSFPSAGSGLGEETALADAFFICGNVENTVSGRKTGLPSPLG